MVALADILDAGAWLAGASALFGGLLGVLRPFMIKEETLDQRVKLHSSVVLERATQRYTASLGELRAAEDVAELRGSPPNTPDVAGDFVNELTRVLSVLGDLKQIRKSVARCYALLLASIGIAALAAITAIVWDETKLAVLVAAIGLVVAQFVLACLVRHQVARLRRYEETT